MNPLQRAELVPYTRHTLHTLIRCKPIVIVHKYVVDILFIDQNEMVLPFYPQDLNRTRCDL